MTAAERRARAVIDRLPPGLVEGAEVGVYDGRMSERLLAIRPDLTLHLVDNWSPGHEQADSFRATGDHLASLTVREARQAMHRAIKVTEFAGDRVHVLYMDSVEAAGHLPDGSLDFAFIDADHSYQGVRQDIEAWLPKVRPGGLLCGHDYAAPEYPGVENAVSEAAERYGWAVETGDNLTWFVRDPHKGASP